MSKWLNTSGTRKSLKLENGNRSKDPQAVQIANILKVQDSMSGGKDIRTWSHSARKTLGAAGGAAFAIAKDGNTYWTFEAPKLAMVVACPIAAQYFTENPEATEICFSTRFIKTRATESIAHWLRVSLTASVLGSIRLRNITPQLKITDLKDALDIRSAMQVLNMTQYIEHFVPEYKATLEYPPGSALDPTKTPSVFRIPSVTEARLVIDHAFVGFRDAVVDALAFHMVVVKKKKGLNQVWTKFLEDPTNFMFANAMKMGEMALTEQVKEMRKERGEAKKQQGQQDKKTGADKGLPIAGSKVKGSPGKPNRHTPRSSMSNSFEPLREIDQDDDDEEK